MFNDDRPTWRNPRVLAILSLVFLTGALFGAMSMRVGMMGRYRVNAAPPKMSASALSYERLIKDKELNLRPDQCKQLKTILDDYARFDEDLQAQLEDWHATGKDQILRILDTKQRERFQKLSIEGK